VSITGGAQISQAIAEALARRGCHVAMARYPSKDRAERAIVPAGEPRGIRAETRLVCLFAVSPPPTAAEHSAVPTRRQP
jgi:NAD(P)-dependent dehydrogenase (short-subunit alcohol dehydrogenase family)